MKTPRPAKPGLMAELDLMRRGLGWSRTQLAKQAGITPTSVCKMLNTGHANLYTVTKVAEAVGLELRFATIPVERRRGPLPTSPHGTYAAIGRHRNAGDPLCRPCLDLDAARKRGANPRRQSKAAA